MSKNLAVFDFDHTIIDANSDTVVRDLIPPEEIPSDVKQLYTSNGWTAYMQAVFEILHKKNVTEEKIKQTVEEIKPLAGMDKLIKELRKNNYDIVIISDSNTYFIDVWLKKYKLHDDITQVFTNPAHFSNGLLLIKMYHLQNDCKLSTKNLCKGRIMEEFIEAQKEKDIHYSKVVFAGDGFNDFCPMTRLNSNDLACARNNYRCANLVRLSLAGKPIERMGEIYKLKCDTLFWDDGFDISNKLF